MLPPLYDLQTSLGNKLQPPIHQKRLRMAQRPEEGIPRTSRGRDSNRICPVDQCISYTYIQHRHFQGCRKIAFAAIAYTISALSNKKHELEPINATTIFQVCQQQLSSSPPQIPQAVVTGLSEASVLINKKIWGESELPDCVTLDKAEFIKRNTPAHPSDLVDRTQGQAVYLYIDLHGNKGQSIRTVFEELPSVYG